MRKDESMTTWLDFEMGADMTHQIEYGDEGKSPRMSMLPMCIPQPTDPKPASDSEPLEEKVGAVCNEKTEG